MSQSAMSPKSFIANEALGRFLRVKLVAASGTNVELADQSDGANFIGWTELDVLILEHTGIILKGVTRTVKAVASEAFLVGATLYAADGGKVSDTAFGDSIGTALEPATADNDVIEMLPDNGSGSQPGPGQIANNVAFDGGIPFILQVPVAGAATTSQYTADAPRKFRVIDAWSRNESANAGTWKLDDGSTDITDAVSVAASDTDVDSIGSLDDATAEIAANGSLRIVHTGGSFAATIYILCLPVA